jgi:hypothetical protein
VDQGIARKTLQGNLRVELNQSTPHGAGVTGAGRRLKIVFEIDKSAFTRILSSVIALMR